LVSSKVKRGFTHNLDKEDGKKQSKSELINRRDSINEHKKQFDNMMITGERTEALYHKGIDRLESVEPLRIFCMTWNMARKKLIVKPE
jgi:hypothetical protein